MAPPSDESLLLEIRKGGEEAFTVLYRRHQGRVYRFAYAMSGDRHVAEEVTQEVFLALLERNTGYRPELGSFLPFLMGMARNQTLRLLRRQSNWVALEEEHSPPAKDTPHERVAEAQKVESVYKAVLSLPPNYREVLILCELQEMDYAGAAQSLGVPIGTVRSRLSRARGLLQEKLRPEYLRMTS